MNLSTNRHKEQTCDYQGGGGDREGWTGSL